MTWINQVLKIFAMVARSKGTLTTHFWLQSSTTPYTFTYVSNGCKTMVA